MDTRITLLRRKSQMGHTQKMVLHCFEYRVLDLMICKQYKSKQYVPSFHIRYLFPSELITSMILIELIFVVEKV